MVTIALLNAVAAASPASLAPLLLLLLLLDAAPTWPCLVPETGLIDPPRLSFSGFLTPLLRPCLPLFFDRFEPRWRFRFRFLPAAALNPNDEESAADSAPAAADASSTDASCCCSSSMWIAGAACRRDEMLLLMTAGLWVSNGGPASQAMAPVVVPLLYPPLAASQMHNQAGNLHFCIERDIQYE